MKKLVYELFETFNLLALSRTVFIKFIYHLWLNETEICSKVCK